MPRRKTHRTTPSKRTLFSKTPPEKSKSFHTSASGGTESEGSLHSEPEHVSTDLGVFVSPIIPEKREGQLDSFPVPPEMLDISLDEIDALSKIKRFIREETPTWFFLHQPSLASATLLAMIAIHHHGNFTTSQRQSTVLTQMVAEALAEAFKSELVTEEKFNRLLREIHQSMRDGVSTEVQNTAEVLQYVSETSKTCFCGGCPIFRITGSKTKCCNLL